MDAEKEWSQVKFHFLVPERRALAVSWLNKPHLQLLTQWAKPRNLGISILAFRIQSFLWSSILGFFYDDAYGPGHVNLAGFWLFYTVGFGRFSSSESGLGSVNYGSKEKKDWWQCYVKGIWFWLRLRWLLKIENSAALGWAVSTKPHFGFHGIQMYTDLYYHFMFFKLQ